MARRDIVGLLAGLAEAVYPKGMILADSLRAGSSGQSPEGGGEDAESAGYAGGILMRSWWREARPSEPRRAADLKVMELQTAKEILAELFHAQPGDVEEMIQRRLEWKSWRKIRK